MHNHAAVFQSDESDIQSDSRSDGITERGGDGIDDDIAKVRYRQKNKNQSFDKDSREGKLPAVAHGHADRVSEESVQSHAGRQRKWHFGIKRHDERSQHGHDGGCGKDSAFVHPYRSEDIRIHGQNIGHGQECSDSREYLCFDVHGPGIEPEKFG